MNRVDKLEREINQLRDIMTNCLNRLIEQESKFHSISKSPVVTRDEIESYKLANRAGWLQAEDFHRRYIEPLTLAVMNLQNFLWYVRGAIGALGDKYPSAMASDLAGQIGTHLEQVDRAAKRIAHHTGQDPARVVDMLEPAIKIRDALIAYSENESSLPELKNALTADMPAVKRLSDLFAMSVNRRHPDLVNLMFEIRALVAEGESVNKAARTVAERRPGRSASTLRRQYYETFLGQ